MASIEFFARALWEEESRRRCVRSGFGPAYGEGAGDRPVSVRLRCVE